MICLKCPLIPLLICVAAVVLKLTSKVRFLSRIWQIRFKRLHSKLAFQQIDLFSCIIVLIDLQVSPLRLEKAADSSLESENKENTTRKGVYAFITRVIRDDINVKKVVVQTKKAFNV